MCPVDRCGWSVGRYGKGRRNDIAPKIGNGNRLPRREGKSRSGWRVLVLAPDIDSKWTRRGPCRETRHVVKTLFFGTPEIVGDSLPKVIAVRQRLPDNLGAPGIGRLESHIGVVPAVQQSYFAGEFLFEFVVKVRRFRFVGFIAIDAIAGFFHLPGTFHARPRAHCSDVAIDVPERRQALERWIDPAVEWNVGRPHEFCFPMRRAIGPYCWNLPSSSAQVGIVMVSVNIRADEITNG